MKRRDLEYVKIEDEIKVQSNAADQWTREAESSDSRMARTRREKTLDKAVVLM